ncbi:MAG: metallophosphoesterase [Bacilli bacterium]|nr:metallophosphoesterase [Bacilli bacterium]
MKKHKILGFIIEITILISLVIAYSYYIEPKLLTFKEYNIKNENITENFQGFKIIHITDIHYGKNYNKENMTKLVNSINDQKPDIVILTGDLIDKKTKMTIELSSEISEYLKQIDAKIGKYAVNGDNDLKFDEWTNIINNGNFKNLNNTYDTIYKNGYNYLLIAGVSTAKDKVSINDKLNKTIEYINSFEKDGPIFKILLMHEPDSIDDIDNNKFDLVLAGHSMHGQIKIGPIPLIIKKGAQKYITSHYKIESSDLYISNGLGNEDYNNRLFNTPSYNIYRLNNK